MFNLLNQTPSYALKAEFRIEDEPLVGLVLSTPSTRAVAVAPVAASKPSGEIRMFTDAVLLTGDGWLEVSGWAVCALGIAQVRVLVDDNPVGLATYGHDRPDVGAAFPDIAHAGLSGFKFRQRLADRFDGEHIVSIVVKNLAGEEKSDTVPATATAIAVEAAPEIAPGQPPGQPAIEAAPSGDPDDFAPTVEQSEEFKFELDSPKPVNGEVLEH